MGGTVDNQGCCEGFGGAEGLSGTDQPYGCLDLCIHT